MDFKKRIGYDDPRIHIKDCDLCGNSVFDERLQRFRAGASTPSARRSRRCAGGACSCQTPTQANGKAPLGMDELVRIVTDTVTGGTNLIAGGKFARIAD